MPKIRGQIRKAKGEAFERIEGEGVKDEQMANLKFSNDYARYTPIPE